MNCRRRVGVTDSKVLRSAKCLFHDDFDDNFMILAYLVDNLRVGTDWDSFKWALAIHGSFLRAVRV